MSKQGLVVTAFGRQFIVEVEGVNYQAVTKAKKTEYVVGDEVAVDMINAEQVQITDLLKRKSLVYRSDMHKSKIIASNVDQILIVIAAKPNCNINFLNNCLIFAASEKIEPIILQNKMDLAESRDLALHIESLYQGQLGYKLIKLAAINECESLLPLLKHKSSLLIGQSGVGKSTITNQLIPDANTRVNIITKSENSGRHTTTNATLYHLDADSILIDCPGLQEFGLYHLDIDQLIDYFPELRNHLGGCRFRNCRHLNEPGCTVTELFKAGKIDELRFNLLKSLTESLQQKTHY